MNTKCAIDGCPITLPVEDMDEMKDGSYICPACSSHLDDMRREEISIQAQRMDEILAEALDNDEFTHRNYIIEANQDSDGYDIDPEDER